MLPAEEQTGTTCQVPWMSFSDLCMPDASQQDMCEWKDSCLMISLDCSSAPWETEFYSHFEPYVGSLENAPNMWNWRKLPSSGVNAVLTMATSWFHVGMRLNCIPLPLSPLPLEGNMDARAGIELYCPRVRSGIQDCSAESSLSSPAASRPPCFCSSSQMRENMSLPPWRLKD